MRNFLRKAFAFATAVAISSGAHAGGLSNPNNTQLPATAGNYVAPAGFLGEKIQSVIATGSSVSLTTGTAANVTSISLTAGNWLVFATCEYNIGGTTTVTYAACSVSPTTAALNGSAVSLATVPGGSVTILAGLPSPTQIISVTSTTSEFLVAQAAFAVSTMTVYGSITAIRIF